MQKLKVCRVCLNDRLLLKSIAKTELQEVYQKLTSIPLKTEDIRPIVVCYVCKALLRKAYSLMITCMRAEEWFANTFVGTSCTLPAMEGSNMSMTTIPPLSIDSFETYEVPIVLKTNVTDKKANICNTEANIEEVLVAEDVKMEGNGLSQDPIYNNDTNGVAVKIEREDVCVYDVLGYGIRATEVPGDDLDAPVINSSKIQKKIGINKPKLAQVKYKDRNKSNVIWKRERKTKTALKSNLKMCEVVTCGNCFTNPECYEAHKRTHSELFKLYKCDHCSKEFRSRTTIYLHMETHDSKTYKCELCGKSLLTSRLLQWHKTLHGNKTYECDLCLKTFKLDKYLKSHKVRVHNISDGLVKCRECSNTYVDRSKLDAHVASMHNGRVYECQICKKVFSSVRSLYAHKKVHKVENFIHCDKCSMTFTDKFTFEYHLRMHTGELPFVCDICRQGFRCRSTLVAHVKRHPVDGVFKCDICKDTFILRTELLRHQRTHAEYQHPCLVCDKILTSAQHLRTHMLIHSGEKPFKCHVCGKAFRLSTTLRDHVRTHTGEKPYTCVECGKGFAQRTPLVTHMKSFGHGLPKVKDKIVNRKSKICCKKSKMV